MEVSSEELAGRAVTRRRSFRNGKSAVVQEAAISDVEESGALVEHQALRRKNDYQESDVQRPD